MEPATASAQSSKALSQSPISPSGAPYPLQCLEILGGNQATQHALASPGLDVWIDSRPYAGARGGDLHYVSMCGSGRVTRFIVADISGHGPDMDEFAQWLRKLVRRYINLLDQTRFARALNRDLADKVGDKKFATVLLATYFAPTHHLIVCNAGHPPPLWYSHLTGCWQYLDQAAADAGPSIRAESARYMFSRVANLPLGIVERTEYRQFAAKLAIGDAVIIYTDAMTEARNPAGEMLGARGLLELTQRTVGQIPSKNSGPNLESREPDWTTWDGKQASVIVPQPAQIIGQRLVDAVDLWRGGLPAEDDQTTIVLHHHGGAPPPLTLGRAARSMARMLGLR
ncbi:MAG TPA: PP2C family protein-serine/threonine phosphatase [Phycisphaerae bacterium]|nr:PP2C family protein-serine/threonine phosphatase [Phycisphaerae bacterium]